VGETPRFFGPLTPQAQTLERLVRNAAQDTSGAALANPDVFAAVARIRAERLAS
jgi:hypothetical protein